jgi:type VI secretion system protein ImpK
MSENDLPAGTPGRRDRTIIRPNPGARRRPAPPPPAPSSASLSYPSALPAQAEDEWISSPERAPQVMEPAAPSAPSLQVEELAAANENPIMRAAGPLLLLLGRLRVALLRAPLASLMEQVANAIRFFEKDIRSAGIPEAQANVAKYILCATADDIVQNIPTEDRHVWTQYSMLTRFFGERIGGVRFFDELDRAKVDPLVNYPVLELLHACLALGFQGIHRTSAGAATTLQQIQRNLYETLRRVRPKVSRDLSPRWRGQKLPTRASVIRIPTWSVAGLAALLLFALYITFRTLLGGGSEAVAESLVTLHGSGRIEIARRAPAPPPPPPPPPPEPAQVSQADRISAQLAPEIGSGKISVTQTGNQIIIRVGDLILFAPGQTRVLDQFKPIAPRIAAILETENGSIRVVGHTDSTPIKSVRFPSNFDLSVERAKAVAVLLKQGLSDPERVVVEGKGADAPVASNDTADGRAKNRRVEVLVKRAD